uniref:uncharacterized protein LOC120889057 n=1 Tax=Ictidomys tridecemlineatus TaxID=43179 RepID=UPI001A9DD53D|nr:uncharacterized protein LOC120889057 [Ictidomys tridecemlineatus]XP_040138778.1 uncharacterized protein LOC120889057 [Ictidomys tridecemlineatus]XP_040138779.1 uncharacterized protein LOC120889057 [Ictidomys tridecemlineatus]XP_040138780.1 uncharacterized protein LOC120889057 [Ictidomys tridecemlineatus]
MSQDIAHVVWPLWPHSYGYPLFSHGFSPKALPHWSVLYGLEHSALPGAPSSLPFHTPNSSSLLSGLYGFSCRAQCPVLHHKTLPSWSFPKPSASFPYIPPALPPFSGLYGYALMAQPLPILPAHSLAHKPLSHFSGLHGIAFLSLTIVAYSSSCPVSSPCLCIQWIFSYDPAPGHTVHLFRVCPWACPHGFALYDLSPMALPHATSFLPLSFITRHFLLFWPSWPCPVVLNNVPSSDSGSCPSSLPHWSGLYDLAIMSIRPCSCTCPFFQGLAPIALAFMTLTKIPCPKPPSPFCSCPQALPLSHGSGLKGHMDLPLSTYFYFVSNALTSDLTFMDFP